MKQATQVGSGMDNENLAVVPDETIYRLRDEATDAETVTVRSEPMTPLERATVALHQAGVRDAIQAAKLALIVAEALFPKDPEPQRLSAIYDAMDGRGMNFEAGDAEVIYGAERGWIGLE